MLKRNSLLMGAWLISCSTIAAENHQDENVEYIEEVLVSAPFEKTESTSMLPVHQMSGEELRQNAASSLGDTLQSLPGVNVASFGPGVGQPVIRGQSGSRVKVLQNSVGILDASSVSQDHDNALNPLVAKSIEVVRGPATLLYGSGAIGGVVNVINNRIPEQRVEKTTGVIEFKMATVDESESGAMTLDGSNADFAWHMDGSFTKTKDVEIPADAMVHGEEAEEHVEDVIENSDQDNNSFAFGGSWLFDKGFVGMAYSELRKNYGIPGEGHGHEEAGGEEHGEEGIRIDMLQKNLDLKSQLMVDSFFEVLRVDLSFIDYEHTELEGDEEGTLFLNEGVSGRLSAQHREIDGLLGELGVQFSISEFSAIGEESFIPEVDSQSVGLYMVESKQYGALTIEFGGRADLTEHESDKCSVDEISLSYSLSAMYDLGLSSNIYVALTQSERAPAIEELYSNVDLSSCDVKTSDLVEHATTQRIELGNLDLDEEQSNNIELGYRFMEDGVNVSMNVFYNAFHDYIYLADTDQFEGETRISAFQQEDAVFYGIEGQALFPLGSFAKSEYSMTVFADWVRAELDEGGNVPRIPPLRYGFELTSLFNDEKTSVRLRATIAQDQDDVAENETVTEGYERVDLYLDHRVPLTAFQELTVFVNGKNLTDEVIRHHVSLLKDVAPEAGRSFEAGLRFSF